MSEVDKNIHGICGGCQRRSRATGEFPIATKRQGAPPGGVLRDGDGSALTRCDVCRVGKRPVSADGQRKVVRYGKVRSDGGSIRKCGDRAALTCAEGVCGRQARNRQVRPSSRRCAAARAAIGNRQGKARALDVVDLPDVGAIGDDDCPVSARDGRAGPATARGNRDGMRTTRGIRRPVVDNPLPADAGRDCVCDWRGNRSRDRQEQRLILSSRQRRASTGRIQGRCRTESRIDHIKVCIERSIPSIDIRIECGLLDVLVCCIGHDRPQM